MSGAITDLPVDPDDLPPEPAPATGTSTQRSPGWWLGRIGGLLVVSLSAGALFAPLLTRYDPGSRVGVPNQRPSATHLLGTNDLGQDLFAQLVFGARVSLSIGILAAIFAVAVGLAVALLAGYVGGAVDAALMRLVDLTLAFPFIPLVLVVATFLGRGLAVTVLVIAAVIWAQPARVLRSQVLKVLRFGHVQAAQGMGASTPRVLARHLLPRVAPLAAAQFVRAANVAITIEAALSFLGLGDPGRMSWGSMLFFANAHNAILTSAWQWWILPPGLALTVTVLGLAFLSFSFEEWGDRRLVGGGTDVGRRRRWAAERQERTPRPLQNPELVLDIQDLHVHYPTSSGMVRALDGVDVALGRGRIVGLVGESGSGKTTLAMTLLGLIPHPGRVAGGTVMLDGNELTAMRPIEVARLRGRTVSLIPQSAMNALNPAYTVRRQIAESAALTREADAAERRADELLRLVGLPQPRAGAYPHELSGGMRQRVVIAMALANDPVLLVADEPLTGLDVLTQAQILRLLLDLRDRLGVAILLISHDLPVASRVVDELVVMLAGNVVESRPAVELVTEPHHPYSRQLLAAYPRLRGSQPAAEQAEPAGDGPSEAPPPLLEFRGVSKTFHPLGGFRRRAAATAAVRGLSLTVQPGEIFALVGESGAGKTTVGRLALGIETPTAGHVIFDGADVGELGAHQRRQLRRRTHLVMQDPYQSLHPAMRVRDLVAEPLAIRGTPRGEWADQVTAALAEVSLEAELLGRYAHELSGGQRQRVALARALVVEPRLVVADEPVSMLDVSLQAGVLELIAALRERHRMAFIFITHDLAVARHIADRIGVLYAGRLVELGPADRVVNRPRHPYTQALIAAVEELAPPPAAAGGLPPGGHPCDRNGHCNPASPECRAAVPVLAQVGPSHFCARHVREPDHQGAGV